MAKTEESSVVDDLKDVEEVDDFFEKILNEDIAIPTDDDEEDTGAETEKKTEEESASEEQQTDESVSALKAKIAELEKEAKGRLGDVVKSRQEKAQFKTELGQLKEAVSILLDKKTNALGKDVEEEVKDPLTDTKKAIEFGEDDKAYVDLKEVKDAISADSEKTRAEIEELKAAEAAREANKIFNENVQSIISEDKDVFSKAYPDLQKTFKVFNDKIIELQNRTGEMGDNGTLSQDQALELFYGSPEAEEFAKEYPGIDPTRIARAFNSKVDLRVGLKHIATARNIGSKENSVAAGLDDKIKAAKNKPGSLAGHENRTAETSDLIGRISNLSTLDLIDLSDAETAKIEQMLLNEELKGE